MSDRKLIGVFVVVIGMLVMAVALTASGTFFGIAVGSLRIPAVVIGFSIITAGSSYLLIDARIRDRRDQNAADLEARIDVGRRCVCGGEFIKGEVNGNSSYSAYLFFRRKGDVARPIIAFRCIACGKVEFYA